MKNTILKIVQQNEYDRYVFITYFNDEIIGLNFWQGIYTESYNIVMNDKGYEPCIHLTDIYNRLKITYKAIGNEELINKAIDLYTEAFVFQNDSTYLPKTQTDIIKEALRFYYEQYKKFNSVPTDTENYKMFDLMTLEAIMNYPIKVEISHAEKNKFSFKHGMDFPIYS